MITRRTVALVALAIVAFGAVTAEAQSREQIDRLTALGQVWGFLKYYHPGVAAGSIDWDSALVATVPKVRAAGTAGEFNAAIAALLDAAGTVRPCVDSVQPQGDGASRCARVSPDSMRINLDFRWLTDSRILGSDIARRLSQIRESRQRGPNRYVGFQLTATFVSDTAFRAPEYPDEGQRLLALFRFWNAARYYFPYMYANGGDWNAVLPEFIPRLIAAKDADEYHLTVAEMTTRLEDAHVVANSAPLARRFGVRLPPFEARSIEGQIVVWKLRGAHTDSSALRVGDVITHVDGEAVAERRRDLGKYVAAGNPSVFERKLVELVLRGRQDSATYTIERDGEPVTRRVAMAPPPSRTLPVYPVTDLAKVLPNGNIGYINMGDLELAEVDSALAIVRNTDGIVMDVRNYPRGTMYAFANFFNRDARPFAKFTSVDPAYPGQVVWTTPMLAGLPGGNATAYRGRVAILVDERTQSHAEFSVMALRTAPENKVIGSQTAGADGNITRLTLPGGILTLFTGLGVYYPDGRETQRIGIVPDIEIRPTLKGLRAGKDEVLERAIGYIRTGR